jgi:hypothetical protein
MAKDTTDAEVQREILVLAPLWSSLEAYAQTMGFDDMSFARSCLARFLHVARDKGQDELVHKVMMLTADFIIPDHWTVDLMGTPRDPKRRKN